MGGVSCEIEGGMKKVQNDSECLQEWSFEGVQRKWPRRKKQIDTVRSNDQDDYDPGVGWLISRSLASCNPLLV